MAKALEGLTWKYLWRKVVDKNGGFEGNSHDESPGLVVADV